MSFPDLRDCSVSTPFSLSIRKSPKIRARITPFFINDTPISFQKSAPQYITFSYYTILVTRRSYILKKSGFLSKNPKNFVSAHAGSFFSPPSSASQTDKRICFPYDHVIRMIYLLFSRISTIISLFPYFLFFQNLLFFL